MQEAGRLTDMFGDIGQERDDVVFHFPFDLVDPVHFERGLLADGGRGAFRDDAEIFHGFGGEGLDFEPDTEAGFRGPDGRHFGTGITGDHARIPASSGLFVRACLFAPLIRRTAWFATPCDRSSRRRGHGECCGGLANGVAAGFPVG